MQTILEMQMALDLYEFVVDGFANKKSCGFVCICMGLLFDLYEFALESYGVGSVIYNVIYSAIYI